MIEATVKNENCYCHVSIKRKNSRNVVTKKIEGSYLKIIKYIDTHRKSGTLYDSGKIYLNVK